MKPTLTALATVFAAASVVNAHFQINYPAVRGPFDEDNEPQFCDGYTQPAIRTRFPLANGVIVWEGEHPDWTIGVMISTAASPVSFNDFHTASGADQLVVDYFKGTGTTGCITIKPNGAGISGIQNGSNVTLQMVYDGGDGKLYQCMDVQLDQDFRTPSDIGCSNPQGQPPSSTGSGSPSSTKSGSTPSSTSTGSSSGGAGVVSTGVSGVLGLGLAGVLAALLM